MSDGLDALVGVIPTIIVGGVAMKMTDSLFNQRDYKRSERSIEPTKTKKKRKKNQINSPFNPKIFSY